MDEAEKLCDYIIVMNKGKILKEGTQDELLKSDNQKVIEFTLEGDSLGEKISNNNSPFKIEWDNKRKKELLL